MHSVHTKPHNACTHARTLAHSLTHTHHKCIMHEHPCIYEIMHLQHTGIWPSAIWRRISWMEASSCHLRRNHPAGAPPPHLPQTKNNRSNDFWAAKCPSVSFKPLRWLPNLRQTIWDLVFKHSTFLCTQPWVDNWDAKLVLLSAKLVLLFPFRQKRPVWDSSSVSPGPRMVFHSIILWACERKWKLRVTQPSPCAKGQKNLLWSTANAANAVDDHCKCLSIQMPPMPMVSRNFGGFRAGEDWGLPTYGATPEQSQPLDALS